MAKKVERVGVKVKPSNEHLWDGKTPTNTPIVAVKWRDIQGVDNWNEEDEVAPARDCHTIGYLLYNGPDPKEKDRNMTVIASWYLHDDDRWSHYVVFPSEVIKSIAHLKGPRK